MYLLCCFFHFQLGWSNLSLMNLFWISTDNFNRTCIYCQHTVLKRHHQTDTASSRNWTQTEIEIYIFFLPKIEFWGLVFRQEDHYGSLILRVVSRDPRLLNMLWHQILWHNVHMKTLIFWNCLKSLNIEIFPQRFEFFKQPTLCTDVRVRLSSKCFSSQSGPYWGLSRLRVKKKTILNVWWRERNVPINFFLNV